MINDSIVAKMFGVINGLRIAPLYNKVLNFINS